MHPRISFVLKIPFKNTRTQIFDNLIICLMINNPVNLCISIGSPPAREHANFQPYCDFLCNRRRRQKTFSLNDKSCWIFRSYKWCIYGIFSIVPIYISNHLPNLNGSVNYITLIKCHISHVGGHPSYAQRRFRPISPQHNCQSQNGLTPLSIH